MKIKIVSTLNSITLFLILPNCKDMYLHLGQNTVITHDKILGIFDIDATTVSKKTRDFLSDAEKNGKVKYVSADLPKSFIVCTDGTVYISQISPATLLKRSKNIE